jgi:hypothetical protein
MTTSSISILDGTGASKTVETLPQAFLLSSTAFTRPADTTAYALGDLVANNTTAGSVTPISFAVARLNGGSGRIQTVRLWKSSTSITNAQFRLHFYSTSPTIANGDNGVWSTTGYVSGVPIYLGSADVVINKAFSDGSMGEGYATYGAWVPFIAASGSQTVYCLIEARAAYTPTSAETFVVTINGDAD